MRSTRTYSATSSRSTSTRSRWGPTTPRRTSPATSRATPSSPSCSTLPRRSAPTAFEPDGVVWRLLQDDPDLYIYPAVGHGITWNARDVENPIRLKQPFELPGEIAAGIDSVSERDGWNVPAPDDYALPTETWREVIARRQHHEEVRAKLTSGEVQDINDLITLNLDIERFTGDVIAQSERPELLLAFWHVLYGNQERTQTGISVLDPTCGSGAFLFAALNVLEPLYTACLEGMLGFFLTTPKGQERKLSPEHLGDFRRILEQVEKHPSERYFILKSIVLNNLYAWTSWKRLSKYASCVSS